jgi:hypothetical protein
MNDVTANAENQIQDSVPKFLRSPKYEQTLKNYDFDAINAGNSQARVPERSQSRSNRN